MATHQLPRAAALLAAALIITACGSTAVLDSDAAANAIVATTAAIEQTATTTTTADPPPQAFGYDAEVEVAEMVAAGVPEPVAACIVETSVETFGTDRLLEFKAVAPVANDADRLDEITSGCISAAASGY